MTVRFGEKIQVELYGTSHGPCIGVHIDGLPAGKVIDAEKLQRFLDRRAPGRNAWSTSRREADRPAFISGVRVMAEEPSFEVDGHAETVDAAVAGPAETADVAVASHAETMDAAVASLTETMDAAAAGTAETVDVAAAGLTETMDAVAAGHAETADAAVAGPAEMMDAAADVPEVVSDPPLFFITTGERLTAEIRNTNTRPQDYKNAAVVPRPAHADYPAWVKYGRIESGGGQFSARLTAALCIAGGIFLQWLEEEGITISAHISSVGFIEDAPFDPVAGDVFIVDHEFPVIDQRQGTAMKELIAQVKEVGDSIGGSIECMICGLPAGIGSPLFGSIESRICQTVFAVPAVKGIEFGTGFGVTSMRGSENNDPFVLADKAGVADETGVADKDGVANETGMADKDGVADETGMADKDGVADETGVADKTGVTDETDMADETVMADKTGVACETGMADQTDVAPKAGIAERCNDRSEAVDGVCTGDGGNKSLRVRTVTNNHGGILGGLSSGMPILFRTAMKPTPSIAIEQQSVDLSTMTPTTLQIKGRHDPCIVPRAVPCIEAAAAVAVMDLLLENSEQ